MLRGTNQVRIADFNQRVVLDAVRRANGGISRVELGDRTGLARQTISNITRRLIDNGLVLEGTPVPTPRGKPRTPLTVAPDGCYAMGLHVDPALLTFVLLNLAGEVTGFSRVRPPAGMPPQEIVGLAAESVEQIVQRAGADPGRILGLGVAAPGPVDLRSGTLVAPPQLPLWDGFPLRARLHEATGLPVLLDKDVTAAATAELRASGAGQQNFVFLYLGAGVGAGIVLDNAVLRGTTNNLGEVGDLLVDPDADDLGWGRPGSLATTCLPQALVGRAHLRGLLARSAEEDYVDWDRGFTELCELAYAGEAAAAALIDESARGVASAIAALVNLLDVDRVVLGGPIWSRLSSRYLATIPAMVAPQLVFRRPVTIEGSAAGEDVAAQGAAALVLDHDLAPEPATFVLDGGAPLALSPSV